jgi:acyl dehydratase
MQPGDILDVVEFRVESGKIREFARATFTTDPVHTEGSLATLTHSVVTGHYRDQRGFVSALGLVLERVVVGSVSWEYARPLGAGDQLVATRRVESDENRRGMRFVTLATEFTDAAGEVVLVQREVLIERGTT